MKLFAGVIRRRQNAPIGFTVIPYEHCFETLEGKLPRHRSATLIVLAYLLQFVYWKPVKE